MKINIFCPSPNIFSNEIFDLIKENKKLNLFLLPKKNTHALLVRFNTKVDKKLISSFPNLKFVISPTTGTNHIDLEYLKQKKIKLISLKNKKVFLKKINASAEHTVALMLSLLKKIPYALDHVKKGKWNSQIFIGEELNNKKIGIIGYGRIGKKVAKICQSFNARISIYDPYVVKINSGFKRFNNIYKLISSSDIISIHIPLEKKTKNFFGKKEFKNMNKNSFLINTSRGEIIDEDILLKYLINNKIKGAALDVINNEKLQLKNKYLLKAINNLNNLIVTPHIAGLTKQSIILTDNYILDLFIKKIS